MTKLRLVVLPVLLLALFHQSRALCPKVCPSPDLTNELESEPSHLELLVLDQPEAEAKQNGSAKSILFGNITKSPGDSREFRGLRLQNGMSVLLISDFSIGEGFAALSVAAGGMNEPPEINGLAHLVEHALFTASSNSPERIPFTKFAASYMGFANAQTKKDSTTFYFHILNSILSEALREFAKLFMLPTFSYSDLVNKTINDVESEFQKNLFDTRFQIDARVRELLVNPNHPAHRFMIGNLKTLLDDPHSRGVNISSACQEFFEKFYSANLMSLVVGGNYSLDKLQEFTEQEFSSLPNRNTSLEINSEPFYSQKELQEISEFKISSHDLILSLDFMLNHSHSTSSQSTIYTKYLLESEHAGGLLKLLQDKDWATSILLSTEKLSGVEILNIRVILTDLGFENTTPILCHIFEYLNEIRSWKPQEWYWNQLRSIGEIEWRFPQSSVTHMEEIVDLSLKLIEGTHVENVQSADKLLMEFDYEGINNLLSFISNPLNAKFTCIGNFSEDRVPIKDTLYPIHYGNSPVSSSFIDTLSNCTSNVNIKMPQSNDYLPNDFQLTTPNLTEFQLMTQEDKSWDVPNVIEATEMSKVWWWNALTKFPEPRLAITLTIRSPFANFDVLSRLCSFHFMSLVRESLAELTQDANKAGISVELYSMSIGIQIKVYGFNDKIPLLIDQILTTLLDSSITDEFHSVNVESLYHQLHVGSMIGYDPLVQAQRAVSNLFAERTFTIEDLEHAHDEITQEYFVGWKKHFFNQVYLEWLFSGNIGMSEAISIASKSEDKFKQETKSRPVFSRQSILPTRDILLNPGKEWLYTIPSDSEHSESATLTLFQLGAKWDPFTQISANILDLQVSGSFYEEMRAKNSLGYVVSAWIKGFKTLWAYVLRVQGPKHPAVVEEHIRKFIDSHILQASPEIFSQHKQKLKEKLISEQSKTLETKHNQFYAKINEKALFNDKDLLLQTLEDITFSQYEEFLQNNFNETSKLKRQLSVYIVPSHMYESDNRTEEIQELVKNKWMITDIIHWKSQQNLHSLYDDSH